MVSCRPGGKYLRSFCRNHFGSVFVVRLRFYKRDGGVGVGYIPRCEAAYGKSSSRQDRDMGYEEQIEERAEYKQRRSTVHRRRGYPDVTWPGDASRGL